MNIFKRFLNNHKAVAAIEFALIAPFLCIMLVGTMEASHYVYARQKVENVTSNISLIMAKQSRLTVEDIELLVKTVPTMMRPIATGANDYGIAITSIQRDKPGLDSYEQPYIFWKINGGEASLVPKEPKLIYEKRGSKKDNKVDQGILRGYEFQEGDQVIHINIGVKYYPIITSGYLNTSNTIMEYSMFTRPRKGAFQFRPDDIE